MADELQERLNKWTSDWFIASEHKRVFGVSAAGQNYAILVTKGIWYKVRVFLEWEYPFCKQVQNGPRHIDRPPSKTPIIESEHTTLAGVDDKIREVESMFKCPSITNLISNGLMRCFQHIVPEDWATSPDKYLRRGDALCTPFVSSWQHAGIYLGNGEVVHMSGHGAGKAAGVVRRGQLVPHFVEKYSDQLFLVSFRVRIREHEDIAVTAERFAADKFRDGEYHLLKKNCQHLVSLCATGAEFLLFPAI